MHIPPSSIVFFLICGIPLGIAYFYILKGIKGFFWRTLGISLLFMFMVIALFILIFVSKDFEQIPGM